MKIAVTALLALSVSYVFGQTKGSLNTEVPPRIEKLQNDYAKEVKDDKAANGYRVQIYNGRRDECMKQRSSFLSLYPNIPAYTVYESPEYRVQVGDFRNRLEAEKFKKAITENFSGSFILKSAIKWPKL